MLLLSVPVNPKEINFENILICVKCFLTKDYFFFFFFIEAHLKIGITSISANGCKDR